ADPICLAVLFGPSLPCAALEALLPRDIFIRTNELSSFLCPRPNPSPDRVKYKPCNFVYGWKDARPQILPVLRILIYNAYLAIFAENANATGRNLESVLDQLKDI
ncbi:hypothetical protein N7536_009227, partial [Penicillium majusculum]